MDTTTDRKLPGTGTNTGVPKRKPVPTKSQPPQSATWDTVPHIFIILVLLWGVKSTWALRWILSGAPILFYCILLGRSHGHRILPIVPLWTLFSSLNLVYAVAATSWLLYWVFTALCYPCIVFCCLFQFDHAANLARKYSRTILRDLHFFNDKVAFFNLPALEFDTRTKGMMVIRGATLSLSTLTLVAHGVEVAVLLSEDMELAIQVDKVTVSLFRNIEIDDVYANVKGGEWEMTFGSLPPDMPEQTGFLAKDTPILQAASNALDPSTPIPGKPNPLRQAAMRQISSTREAFDSVVEVSADDDANKRYQKLLQSIEDTSSIKTTHETLKKAEAEEDEEHSSDSDSSEKDSKDKDSKDKDSKKPQRSRPDLDNINDLRAAIAAQIQSHPSIAHPPSQSIRLSTLKKTSHPKLKRFLHRLPLLYRLLLNPIAYFHPVSVKSLTTAGSGRWFKYLMDRYFFKHYSTSDPEIRRLESRISTWLSDANYAVELVDMQCTAQVPVNVKYDIECRFKITDVMAYRALPGAVVDLTQVFRIGGGDATLSLPTYLLPHHEHIFPRKPTEEDIKALEHQVEELKDSPLGVQMATALEQLKKDETNMHIAAHAHLPLTVNQELLNFIAALVKATKVIETDKDFEELKALRELRRGAVDSDAVSISSASSLATVDTGLSDTTPTTENNKPLKQFLRKVDTGLKEAKVNMRDGMRKAGLSTASAMANDRWIAKLVGRLLRKLEKARGEVGYAFDVPIWLGEFRESYKWEDEVKILV
ncbi:hypothetical protein M011DRAFT_413823 [Sporormia fimetaria CBS 119925]|uniref:Uncharacterized protein n=1 Tax=Sporormia fimetaria CBS 119925 TaxID=1340428 RepID=A0A6A6UVJ8_9PLEO|nr:hypothetical protein M011DRAFT_413823 [Sporormia fimetaria CBS 119925]